MLYTTRKHRATCAFTLIELLIVIVIIAILAGIVLPVFGSVQLAARRTQSLSNMRQLGTALIAYGGDNNSQLPTEGDSAPTWSAASQQTPAQLTAWYNVLPRKYANSRGVGDFTTATSANFYSNKNLLYVPAAKYPSNKLTLSGPLFAVAFCSKFYGSVGGLNIDPSLVRFQNFQRPAETVVFQESGLLGEKQIRTSQSSYNGQSKSFASRSVARYGDKTLLVFADGHADLVTGTDIVAGSGKAYSPQIGPAGGKVYWTLNPNADAN